MFERLGFGAREVLTVVKVTFNLAIGITFEMEIVGIGVDSDFKNLTSWRLCVRQDAVSMCPS